MIFLKKIITPSQLFANLSQIFANTQTKLATAFATVSLVLKQKKIFSSVWLLARLLGRLPGCFGAGFAARLSRLGALFLFLACTFGLLFFAPSQGFAQTAQHELKATVLPPASTGKGQTKDISANTTANTAGNTAGNAEGNAEGNAAGAAE